MALVSSSILQHAALMEFNNAQAVNTAHGVSTASTQVNDAYSTSIDNLSDAIICAFFASQPNSHQLVHDDLQQIQPEYMEEMDFKMGKCSKWSATTAIRGGILLKSAELQEIKTTRIRKAQKECVCGNLLPHPLVSCDGLVDYDWSEPGRGRALFSTQVSHLHVLISRDYEEIDGGYVAFGGNPKGGKSTRKGTIKTGNLDFEIMYFVRALKFNLFSVSQMCDKKNSVLFNDIECIVLSPNFKIIDESQVLLRVPRKDTMYSVDLKNILPKGGLTCLFAKATSDESKLWHRRLGHLNFKTINKLVFRNKKDKRGIVIRNKARLVDQEYTQEEGIDYDEVFAHVARIEAIRLFLAYASFKDFVVYQMDVKSVFLYKKIEEEVYVCQPPGFEDPNFPDRVYKVEKALYRLHQALRACLDRMSTDAVVH
ncbi:ribonuclease H-like domain-containing protein [Tanacetum coccineum]